MGGEDLDPTGEWVSSFPGKPKSGKSPDAGLRVLVGCASSRRRNVGWNPLELVDGVQLVNEPTGGEALQEYLTVVLLQETDIENDDEAAVAG